MRYPWTLWGILLAAAPVWAQAPEPTQPPAAPPPAASAQAPRRETSATEKGELASAARSVVARVLPEAAEEVRVEVDENGVLTVSGEVPLLSDKLALNDALTELPGADITVNRLATEPVRRSDAAIARDVRRRFANDPVLRELGFGVRVDDQQVFLQGRAPSGIDVKEALRAAASVRGVKDVHTERLEASVPLW